MRAEQLFLSSIDLVSICQCGNATAITDVSSAFANANANYVIMNENYCRS